MQKVYAMGVRYDWNPAKNEWLKTERKGMQMGVPYQALISGIIHRYIEGDSVSRICGLRD